MLRVVKKCRSKKKKYCSEKRKANLQEYREVVTRGGKSTGMVVTCRSRAVDGEIEEFCTGWAGLVLSGIFHC